MHTYGGRVFLSRLVFFGDSYYTLRYENLHEDLKTEILNIVIYYTAEEPYLVQQYKTRLKNALSVEGDTMNTSVFPEKIFARRR